MEGTLFDSVGTETPGGLFGDAAGGNTKTFEELFGKEQQSEPKVDGDGRDMQEEAIISQEEDSSREGCGSQTEGPGGLNTDPPAAEQPVIQAPTPTRTLNECNQDDGGGVLAAAMAQRDLKAAGTVFEKPALFTYDKTEDVIDPNMTFEELRVAKAGDFPILDDPKKVTWVVDYGKTSKKITAPKTTSIGEVKKGIEMASTFLAEVKSDTEGKLRCRVKPTINAQTKGKLAEYKGLFESEEEAHESGKPICLLPGRDGNLYEMRKSDVGVFVTPSGCQQDLEEVRVGFYPTLPLVPYEVLTQTIDFFRAVMNLDDCKRKNLEALVNVYWDTVTHQFVLHVPKQVIAHASVDTDLSEAPDPSRFIHYMDIHSHNNMEARFSGIDDEDEKATRIYVVVGRLDKFYPVVTVRLSNGGKYLEISPNQVFEAMPCCPHDPAWKEQLIYRNELAHQLSHSAICLTTEELRRWPLSMRRMEADYEVR